MNVCFAFLDCAAYYNAEEQIAFLFFQRRARFSHSSLVMQTCTSDLTVGVLKSYLKPVLMGADVGTKYLKDSSQLVSSVDWYWETCRYVGPLAGGI